MRSLPLRPGHVLRLAFVGVVAATVDALSAQTPEWLDVSPMPLTSTAVYRPDRGTTLHVETTPRRLWEWDGSSFRRLLGVAPPNSITGPGTWDPVNRRAVFSRGFAWDGANWHNLPMPSGIAQFGSVAFDAVRQRLVGLSSAHVYEWDGVAWARITPPASPGEGFGLVFDPQRGRCVLVAGQAPTLYDWDGAQWSVVDSSLPGQVAGFTASLVHDPIHGRLVLHGKSPGAGNMATTWQYRNGAWQTLGTPTGFTYVAHLTFDGVGLLRLGADASAPASPWRLEGNQWRQLPPRYPPKRTQHAVASASTPGGVWMFGGRLDNSQELADLWRFDGSWTEVVTANGPAPRRDAAMAWSPVDQAFLLHGGRSGTTTVFDDTWLWNGVAWQQRIPSTTPGELLQLATDPSGGVLGLSASAGTTALRWLWDGSDWSSSPAPSAFASSVNHVAHDPVRNVVVAVGANVLAEWNGSTWTQGPPAYQWSARIAYRPDNGRMLISDGASAREWDGATLVAAPGGAATAFTVATPDFAVGRLWSFRNPGTVGNSAATAYLTAAAHRAERLAYGCSLASVPGVLGVGMPRPGNPAFGVEAETMAPTAPVVVALGFLLQGSHLGGGCVAWLHDPAAVHFRIADATGRAHVPLPIPNAPSLHGVELLAQAGTVDPANSPIGSIVVSDVLRITIGD